MAQIDGLQPESQKRKPPAGWGKSVRRESPEKASPTKPRKQTQSVRPPFALRFAWQSTPMRPNYVAEQSLRCDTPRHAPPRLRPPPPRLAGPSTLRCAVPAIPWLFRPIQSADIVSPVPHNPALRTAHHNASKL